jgi:hypothetical protein
MVRFPDGMRDEIRLAAENNGRSMNEEILRRLEQTIVHGDSWEADKVIRRMLICLLYDRPKPEKEAAIYEAYSFLAGLHLSSREAVEAWEKLRPTGKLLGLKPIDNAEINEVINKMVEPEIVKMAEYLRAKGWMVEPPPSSGE